ncbi:phosphatidylglycerol lysyltransferase domain-containing protein [Oscillospiraceae bacterium PP1C4]
MIDFRKISLSDKAWIDSLLAMGNHRGSEYTFSNNFNYREIYHIDVARMNDYYLVHSGKEASESSYLYPSGSGDIKPVIQALMEDAKARGVAFQMHAVPKEGVAVLETLFPNLFTFEEMRDIFDYIYESQSLITLAGKKLHSKRNFINRFQAEHDGSWSYEPITMANIDECWAMNIEWCAEAGCGEDPSLREESCAVKNCFHNFTALGLSGGVLRVDGKIVAYTMGLPLNSDTFIVHIEKAFSSVAGAYPMINQQFVTHTCADYQYVNREDDVGNEGLRKAKLSYRPAILLEKYLVRLK